MSKRKQAKQPDHNQTQPEPASKRRRVEPDITPGSVLSEMPVAVRVLQTKLAEQKTYIDELKGIILEAASCAQLDNQILVGCSILEEEIAELRKKVKGRLMKVDDGSVARLIRGKSPLLDIRYYSSNNSQVDGANNNSQVDRAIKDLLSPQEKQLFLTKWALQRIVEEVTKTGTDLTETLKDAPPICIGAIFQAYDALRSASTQLRLTVERIQNMRSKANNDTVVPNLSTLPSIGTGHTHYPPSFLPPQQPAHQIPLSSQPPGYDENSLLQERIRKFYGESEEMRRNFAERCSSKGPTYNHHHLLPQNRYPGSVLPPFAPNQRPAAPVFSPVTPTRTDVPPSRGYTGWNSPEAASVLPGNARYSNTYLPSQKPHFAPALPPRMSDQAKPPQTCYTRWNLPGKTSVPPIMSPRADAPSLYTEEVLEEGKWINYSHHGSGSRGGGRGRY